MSSLNEADRQYNIEDGVWRKFFRVPSLLDWTTVNFFSVNKKQESDEELKDESWDRLKYSLVGRTRGVTVLVLEVIP